MLIMTHGYCFRLQTVFFTVKKAETNEKTNLTKIEIHPENPLSDYQVTDENTAVGYL